MQLIRWKPLLLLLLLCYAGALNYLILIAPPEVFPPPELTPLSAAVYRADPADHPGMLPAGNWRGLELPHEWQRDDPAQRQGWYRLHTQLAEIEPGTWAIYLPHVAHNAAVYINRVWVGQGGPFSEPVSRHHNEPLLFAFSTRLLHRGENTLEIRLAAGDSSQGYLDRLYLGPIEQLEPAYRWKYFVRVTLVQWITVSMYGLAALVFLFWIIRPQDRVYGWFSLELFIWATHNLNLLVTEIPLSSRLWEAMTMSTLGWTVVTMLIFNHRYVGHANRTIERMLLLFSLLGIGIFLLPDVGSVLYYGYIYWDSLLMVFGCYAIYHLTSVFWKSQHGDVYLMLLAGIPILVCGLHDILVVNHHIDARDGLIIQYSVVPALLLFSWFMIRRFVESVNLSERMTQTLEQQVAEKELALREQFKRLTQYEKEQALIGERERIMRDMHDGIGGQLISLITLLDSHSGPVFERIRARLHHSLADLRLVIDSLDPLLSDLPTLLGMMRKRLFDQMADQGIELEWCVTDLPPIGDFSPCRSLHIMRIVQEAVTNSIKHAETDRITLATGVLQGGDSQVYIDIIDYGAGMQEQLANNGHKGRGLANMRYRAEQLGGALKIDSNGAGTCVRLLFGVV